MRDFFCARACGLPRSRRRAPRSALPAPAAKIDQTPARIPKIARKIARAARPATFAQLRTFNFRVLRTERQLSKNFRKLCLGQGAETPVLGSPGRRAAPGAHQPVQVTLQVTLDVDGGGERFRATKNLRPEHATPNTNLLRPAHGLANRGKLGAKTVLKPGIDAV